ncbi:MAG TPA: hypothetical protein VKR61_26115 [Bryobacteraceae bacterium]|nr:hypothetical protein [Bryobacteraceae bacterium]
MPAELTPDERRAVGHTAAMFAQILRTQPSADSVEVMSRTASRLPFDYQCFRALMAAGYFRGMSIEDVIREHGPEGRAA